MLRRSLILWLVLASGVVGAATAPTQELDKPAIPPDLYIEIKTVPAEDNAIINWRRAAEAEVPLDEKLFDVESYSWTPGGERPTDEDFDALRAWTRRNKEALSLFESSLLKPKAQWVERDSQKRQPEIAAFAHLIRARIFLADCLAQEKKYEEAVASLEKSLRLTQLGIEGNASLIHYLLCTSGRILVQNGMMRLASRREVPTMLLERMLKDLPPLDSETNVFANVLRVGFTREHDHNVDVRAMAENWAKDAGTNSAWYFPEELQRPFRVLLDPSLVAMHPKPLDEVRDVRRDIQRFRIYRTNCVGYWSNRNDIIQQEDAETIKNLKEEITPLMELVKDEPLPLSKRAAERARAAYLSIDDPIGKIFSGSVLTTQYSDIKVFRVRAEREAARAIIALLLFEHRNGTLPRDLTELVSEKILKEIPTDPFAAAPLHYSREKRIVWSVSEDGEDDGGDGADQPRWLSSDAVWKIPNLN